MGAKQKIALAGAVLLAIPLVANPVAWPLVAVLVVAWLLVVYGVAYLLDLEKYRRQGERAEWGDIRHREEQ